VLTAFLAFSTLGPVFAQVSGRAQESLDQAKQSSQQAWGNTKSATQETVDKVRRDAAACLPTS
jgi:hypothetical protein